MTKLAIQRTEELKELKEYVAQSTRPSEAIDLRIEWLQKNLDTPQSKEERQMLKESKAHTSAKTLTINL